MHIEWFPAGLSVTCAMLLGDVGQKYVFCRSSMRSPSQRQLGCAAELKLKVLKKIVAVQAFTGIAAKL